jgi:hypothetical protein
LGLTSAERKKLEALIKAAINDAKTCTDLARRIIPRQGDIQDFAYGLICGMLMGNFMELFSNNNGRQPDKDEMTDLFLIMMTHMPSIRNAVINEL